MIENNILVNTFEKAAQEYYKELGDYFWSLVGVLVSIAAVLFGIYFSQIAIAQVVGAVGLMRLFSWSVSILVSPLEIAAIKMFGNKERRDALMQSNKGEFYIALSFSGLLFGFDISTNLLGLWVIANKIAIANGTVVGWGWIVIIFFGSLMAVSELLTGWMLRSTAVSYVSYHRAKVKYEQYKKELDKSIRDGSIDRIPTNTRSGSVKTRLQDKKPLSSYKPPIQSEYTRASSRDEKIKTKTPEEQYQQMMTGFEAYEKQYYTE